MTILPRASRSVRLKGLRRRGTAYVFVLTGSLLVVVAGVTAVRLSTASVKGQAVQEDGLRATLAAQSGLEMSSEMLANDPGGFLWRSSAAYASTLNTDLDGTGVTMDVLLRDPNDADLTNNRRDDVQLAVRVVAGSAQRQVTASFRPVMTPMACLDDALTARTITVGSGKTLVVSGTQHAFGANDPVNPLLVDWSQAEAANATTYTAATRTAANAMPSSTTRRLPAPALIDQWASLGTRITISSDRTIERVVFSPTNNPISGPANPLGIYVLDVGNNQLTLKNLRVYGTLIILAGTSKPPLLEGEVHMETASPDRPVLLVRGNLIVATTPGDLLELPLVRNFNPAGAPHLGVTDSDLFDTYPNMLDGLVYVDGSVTVNDHMTVEGHLFVTGTLLVNEELIVRYSRIEGTPMGFSYASGIRVLPGSVTR